GGGACRLLFSLIKIQASIIDIRHIAGKAKNTEYQTIRPKSDPMIGDKTFPIPFDASTIPRTRLCSPPLNKSAASAIAIGAIPAAPIPWIILPIRIYTLALENAEAAKADSR